MDNLTHSLTGLALSRAGLDKFSPRAVWLLVLSANAPDADVVATSQGAFRYFEVHRGYTHSLLGLPFMAALTVLVVAAVSREKLPWFRAWLLCIVGVASHLLLDWTNSYGIRLLLPFSSRWFHLDLNDLYDGFILAVLIFATIWPLFSRLVNREIGEQRASVGRPVAVFALMFFLLFDLARSVLHARVVSQLNSRLYGGLSPLHTAALPNPFNPLRWTAVVETPSSYQLSEMNSLSPLNSESPTIFYKPPLTTSLSAARAVEPFRYFLYFSRFPVWSIQPVTGQHTRGTRLDLTDLRFGAPGSGAFHCVAFENELNQVMGKWFTYGSGTDLGWDPDRPSASAK